MTDIEDVNTLRIFQFIRDFIDEHGFSPSQREIARGTFLATTTTVNHIAKLEGYGWITRDYNIPRSIRIADNAPNREKFESLWHAANGSDESP